MRHADVKLQKLINEASVNFNSWIDTINDHNSMYSPKKNLTEEEQTNLIYETSGVLSQISELFFKYGSFKDSFDNSMMYLHIHGPELIIKSLKTENEFHFGIGEEGLYLSTYMRYPENLRHMGDEFYKDIFTLEELGNFDVQENQLYSTNPFDNYNLLFKSQKSKIFRLIRNYIYGFSEGERNILLGDFHITWIYNTDFYDIVHNSCIAFKILYRLNYSLWKIHDLQSKKK